MPTLVLAWATKFEMVPNRTHCKRLPRQNSVASSPFLHLRAYKRWSSKRLHALAYRPVNWRWPTAHACKTTCEIFTRRCKDIDPLRVLGHDTFVLYVLFELEHAL